MRIKYTLILVPLEDARDLSKHGITYGFHDVMPGLQVNLQLTVALIKTRSKTYTNLVGKDEYIFRESSDFQDQRHIFVGL